jgi:hypothetical protein
VIGQVTSPARDNDCDATGHFHGARVPSVYPGLCVDMPGNYNTFVPTI